MCPGVFAQRESKLEVALGIGTDIIRSSLTFKNDRSLSASLCYNLTDRWGIVLYLGQQAYSFDRLSSDHETYLDGTKPQLSKTVTSGLLLGRYFIPTKLASVSPYVSFGMGCSKSVSSAEGYYIVNFVKDTVFVRTGSGQFFLGLLSLGIEVEPVSSLNLFAELQLALPSDRDLYPSAIAGRIGIAVTF